MGLVAHRLKHETMTCSGRSARTLKYMPGTKEKMTIAAESAPRSTPLPIGLAIAAISFAVIGEALLKLGGGQIRPVPPFTYASGDGLGQMPLIFNVLSVFDPLAYCLRPGWHACSLE